MKGQHVVMPEATATAGVPLALASAAIDEIYNLRTGAAYEVAANRATLYMRLPKSSATILADVNETLLVPAALGKARALVAEEVVPRRHHITPAGWERQRALSRVREHATDKTTLIPGADYLTALGEIEALRNVFAEAAKRLARVTAPATFPKSRREIHERQASRVSEAARTGFAHAYLANSRSTQFAMREVGAKQTLTLFGFLTEDPHAD